MDSILEIYKLLDWNNNQETQSKGIFFASQINNLSLLIQPCLERYNKNIWENCALVLTQKTNDELSPYLLQLLEWIQDLNWPGAMTIYERLRYFDNRTFLDDAIDTSLIRSKVTGDVVWQQNLLSLQEEID